MYWIHYSCDENSSFLEENPWVLEYYSDVQVLCKRYESATHVLLLPKLLRACARIAHTSWDDPGLGLAPTAAVCIAHTLVF